MSHYSNSNCEYIRISSINIIMNESKNGIIMLFIKSIKTTDICQSEIHYKKLKINIFDLESCLRNITFSNSYLIVPIT